MSATARLGSGIIFASIVLALVYVLVLTPPPAEGEVIDVYKTPTCGCCTEYEDYLRSEGFEVNSHVTTELNAFRDDLGLPRATWSCHTSMIGGYFVEGHVPVEVIRQLLLERPAVDGISLPSMPSGTPGMGGTQLEPWTIFGIRDGVTTIYTVVE